jgi:hypothetical protein
MSAGWRRWLDRRFQQESVIWMPGGSHMIRVDPELLRPRLGRLCGWSGVNVVVPLNAGSVCGAGALVPMGQEG